MASGIPLAVASLDATVSLKLECDDRRRIFQAGIPLGRELHALYQLWGKGTPVLFDPLAVALCFDEHSCTMADLCLRVDDQGFTRPAEGKPNARVAMSVKRDEFLKWFTDRLASRPRSSPDSGLHGSGLGVSTEGHSSLQARPQAGLPRIGPCASLRDRTTRL